MGTASLFRAVENRAKCERTTKIGFPSITIRTTGEFGVLAVALAVLLSLAGCVQSIFPWHADEDVVFDANLAGAWIGDGDTEGCSLNITADPTRQVRHYS
jgi:hypothetical protein